MSDLKTILKATFINRRTGQAITEVPVQNTININIDVRTLTTTFDFDVLFKFSETIGLRSHDFVEFYFNLPSGEKFQVTAGFIEDFVRETGTNKLRFQANGRDFLGQLFQLPFLIAKPVDTTSFISFLSSSLSGSYLNEYLAYRNIKRNIVNLGAYGAAIKITELAGSKIAPVIQQMSDEIFNVVYQNRFGQAVVWGRSQKDANNTGMLLSDSKDLNVNDFVARQNYSRVVSSVKMLYTGAEQNVNYALQPTKAVFNSDSRARQIFNPEVRNFQTSTLITYLGESGIEDAKYKLASSIMRKSNQNLNQVVIKTTRPFYITTTGQIIPYEVNQVWPIYSKEHEIKEDMRLVGIGYNQTSEGLNCQLCFIPKDTLV